MQAYSISRLYYPLHKISSSVVDIHSNANDVDSFSNFNARIHGQVVDGCTRRPSCEATK